MNRFAKIALIALFAFGAFALIDIDNAEAGGYHGNCYRPAYTSCYYTPSCHTQIYYPAFMPTCWGSSCYSGFYSGHLSTITPYGQRGW